MTRPPLLRFLSRASVALVAVGGAIHAQAQTAIVIGGALRFDNDLVWQRIVDEAGGPDKARFAVLATAAANPARSAELIIEALERRGAKAEHIPVAPRMEGVDIQKNLNDPELLAKVRGANAVFFSGGAQGFIVDTLQPGGRPTPMLQAIWDVYRRGGVVAGTSAGAAIMSRVMFRDALDVMGVLRGQMRDGQEIDQGLGFVGDQLLVDQHFLKRGRVGRLLPLMVAKGYKLGLGVEENSAAVIRDQRVDIVGARGALLVDLKEASTDPAMGAFNLRGARLSYLDNGDHHDLRTGITRPAMGRAVLAKGAGAGVGTGAGARSGAGEGGVERAAQGGIGAPSRAGPGLASAADARPAPLKAQPVSSGLVDSFQPDILGDNRIVQAMAELLTSPAQEVRAMARRTRPGASGERERLGFVFRLYRGPGTQGWVSPAGDAEPATMVNVRLDVRPVRLPEPPTASSSSLGGSAGAGATLQ